MKLESDNAMDILSKLNELGYSNGKKYDITEQVWGFCCDNGHYGHEYENCSLIEVYWTVVNFAGGNWSFMIEWSEKTGPWGGKLFDRDAPVIVTILDSDCGEWAHRSFTIVKD